MKRLFILIIILLCASVGFCDPPNNTTELEYQSQVIAGYIGEYLEWNVSAFKYANAGIGNYSGINLDINDPSNNLRFQIAPTQIPLSTPGLLVGSFNFFSSDPHYHLVIKPYNLVNDSDSTIDVEYELFVRIFGDFQGSDESSYGLMNTLSSNDGSNNITIDWSQAVLGNANYGAVMVQNSGIYFRLSRELTPQETGTYSARILFSLETI